MLKVDFVVNYNNLISYGLRYFDNSSIMLLNLLLRVGKQSFAIAGLDGFDYNAENYYSTDYNLSRYEDDYEQINNDLTVFLRNYAKRLDNSLSVQFLTPSRFSNLF